MAGFRDPIDDEADEAEGVSVGKRSKELADRLGSMPEREPTEVEIQEPEEDEEAEELAEAKASRKDKRAARSTARERAAAAEARAQVLQEQLEITRRNQPTAAPAQRQGNPVADIDARIKGTNQRLAAVHDEWNRNAGKLSKEREAKLVEEAEALEVEKITLVHQRVAALEAPVRERAEHARMLQQRAPDVHANPQALQYAQGLFQQRAARGEPDSLELYDAVMQEAREVILGKRGKPDAAQRQRASGIGSGPAGHRDTGSGAKVSMTKGSPLYRLACAQYPELDPAAACQKWANKNGKAFLERTGSRR